MYVHIVYIYIHRYAYICTEKRSSANILGFKSSPLQPFPHMLGPISSGLFSFVMGCEQELKKRVCTEDTGALGGRDGSRCHAQGQTCPPAKLPNSCIAGPDCKESPAVCIPRSTGEQEVFRADQPERYRPTIFGNVGA